MHRRAGEVFAPSRVGGSSCSRDHEVGPNGLESDPHRVDGAAGSSTGCDTPGRGVAARRRAARHAARTACAVGGVSTVSGTRAAIGPSPPGGSAVTAARLVVAITLAACACSHGAGEPPVGPMSDNRGGSSAAPAVPPRSTLAVRRTPIAHSPIYSSPATRPAVRCADSSRRAAPTGSAPCVMSAPRAAIGRCAAPRCPARSVSIARSARIGAAS